MPSFPGLNRANNVPAWQRLHQNHDGLRQWQKVRYNLKDEHEEMACPLKKEAHPSDSWARDVELGERDCGS